MHIFDLVRNVLLTSLIGCSLLAGGGYKVILVYGFLYISYQSGYYFAHYSNGLYAKLYHHWINENEEKEEKKALKEKYEEKYLDRFDKLELLPLSREKVEALKNTIVMETTPLGNVIMYWDQRKEAFTYFSDATIPYRYLEVVARKYVIVNQCKDIYIDMREELKTAKRVLDEKKRRLEEEHKTEKEVPKKKSVFAQLKQYNHLTAAADPKTSAIPTPHPNTRQKEEKPTLVKERANIYSREGKMNQFSFLKREWVDKRKELSFSDYKRSLT